MMVANIFGIAVMIVVMIAVVWVNCYYLPVKRDEWWEEEISETEERPPFTLLEKWFIK